MKTFRIFFRVPANTRHGGYLSDTCVDASDKLNAVGRFMAERPECSVITVFNGL